LVSRLRSDEQTVLLTLAVVIGAAAGGAVVVFYKAIDVVQAAVLRGTIRAILPEVILIPLAAGLGLAACWSLIHWGTRDSPGENVPDVMYRVNLKGGVIGSTKMLFKTLGAALVIGTGGSVGQEGPVIVAGAAVASRIGRWLHASPNRLRTLAGCGAAAGLSAAFNAPIAGVIFGIEKILGSAGGLALGPFVVASIIAAMVGRAAFGNHPVLALPASYGLGAPWELVLYVPLGIATGAVSVLYTRGVWTAGDLFRRLDKPWKRLVVGAVLLGALDIAFRANLWGHGHQSLDAALVASRSALFLLGLSAAKLVATAVTLGAGGYGGVFTPALFIGATLGGAMGVAAQNWLGGLPTVPGAMALVGMAGVVAGATHAPLTAIVMVFEMTGDYGLILPLMLTSVLAYGIAHRLYPESIYTEWLVRRGVVLAHGADAAVLARIPVSDCLNRQPATIREDAHVASIVDLARHSRQVDFPVVDADGELVGFLADSTLRAAVDDGRLSDVVIAADLAHPVDLHVTPDDSLLTALRRLGALDVNSLPVVSRDDPNHLEGTVSRQDLLAAYERALTLEHL
jgi:CIC family chloride channel protein